MGDAGLRSRVLCFFKRCRFSRGCQENRACVWVGVRCKHPIRQGRTDVGRSIGPLRPEATYPEGRYVADETTFKVGRVPIEETQESKVAMTRLYKVHGFTYFPTDPPSDGVRGSWKAPGCKRQFKTFPSLAAFREEAKRLAALLGLACEEDKKLDKPLPTLAEALVLYDATRFIQKDSSIPSEEHMDWVRGALKKMFAFCGWKLFSDIDEEKIREYQVERANVACTFHKELGALKTFIRRFRRDGVKYPDWLHDVVTVAPEPEQIHTAWPMDVFEKWFRYLTKDMELLAAQDPSWSWYERIRRCCHTVEFSQRMLLVVPQILQARALYRPGESRRVQVSYWNGELQMLRLSKYAAKAGLKSTLTDNESTWLFNLACLGQNADAPLAQFNGHEWTESHLYHLVRRHLNLAGLDNWKPYDVKYTLATFIYHHPELFKDETHYERMKRVREVLGHGKDSKSTKRYVEALFGSEAGPGMKSFFDVQKLFPFDVAKYPVPVFRGTYRAASRRRTENQDG